MEAESLSHYLPLLVILGLGIVFAGLFIFLAYAFGPKKPTLSKLDTYECGVPILEDARERFSVKFFLVAMIFLVFDVEVVFLFPWAILLREFKLSGQGLFVFASVAIFILMLAIGMFYEWKRGAMEWES